MADDKADLLEDLKRHFSDWRIPALERIEKLGQEAIAYAFAEYAQGHWCFSRDWDEGGDHALTWLMRGQDSPFELQLRPGDLVQAIADYPVEEPEDVAACRAFLDAMEEAVAQAKARLPK